MPFDSFADREDYTGSKPVKRRTMELLREWNTRQNKKFLGSKSLRALDMAFRPIDAITPTVIGIAGTIGSAVGKTAKNIYRASAGFETEPIKQIARDIGAPMAAGLEEARETLVEGTQGVSNSWDGIMSRINEDYDVSYNTPPKMPKNKIARFAIDVADPFGNKIADVVAKPALNTTMSLFRGLNEGRKYVNKVTKLDKAIAKVSTYIKGQPGYKTINSWSKKVVNEIENNPRYNVPIQSTTRYIAGIHGYISRAARGYEATIGEGQRRVIEVMYSDRQSKFTRQLDRYIAARKAGDTVEMEKAAKIVHSTIPATRDNIDEFADLYQTSRNMSKEERAKAYKLAYSYGSGEMANISDLYTQADISKKADIDLLSDIHTQQNIKTTNLIEHANKVGLYGIKDVGIDIAQTMGDDLNSLPDDVRNTLINTTEKIMSYKWLRKHIVSGRSKPISPNQVKNIIPGIMHVFDHDVNWESITPEARSAMVEAMKDLMPILTNSSLSNTTRKEVMNMVVTIPEMITNADRYHTLSKSIKALKSMNPDDAMEFIKKHDFIEQYIKTNKINNTVMKEHFLNALATGTEDEKKLHGLVKPILDDAIKNNLELDNRDVYNKLSEVVQTHGLETYIGTTKNERTAQLTMDAIDILTSGTKKSKPAQATRELRDGVLVFRYFVEEALKQGELSGDINSVVGSLKRIAEHMKTDKSFGKYAWHAVAEKIARKAVVETKQNYVMPFIKMIKPRATVESIEAMFNEGLGNLKRGVPTADPIWEATRQYADITNEMEKLNMPGVFVDKARVKELAEAKVMALDIAKQNGINEDFIKGLSKMVLEEDQVFGRFFVRHGMMDNEQFVRNQGWHLRRGYELYTDDDILKKVEERVAGMPQAQADAIREEAQSIINQRKTGSLLRNLRNINISREAKTTGNVVFPEGGLATTFLKPRTYMSKEMQEILGVYDDIAAVHQLNAKLHASAGANALHLAALEKFGLVENKNIGDFIQLGKTITKEGAEPSSWGKLSGKFVHPWLATRLQWLFARDEAQALDNFIVHMVSEWKGALITSVPTMLRNLASNAMAIYITPEMEEAGVSMWNLMSHGKRMAKEIADGGGTTFERYSRHSDSMFHNIGPVERSVTRGDKLVDTKSLLEGEGSMAKLFRLSNEARYAGNNAFSATEKHAKLTMFSILTDINPKTGAQYFSDAEAVKIAEKTLIDYADVPPIVDALRRFTPSFITYPTKMAANLVEWAYRNPGKQVSLYNKIRNANRASYEDYNTEIKMLPDTRQNKLLLRIGGDKMGKPTYLDLTYYIPHSIFMFNDVDMDDDPLTTTAAKVFMNFFGPMFDIVSKLSTNRDKYGNIIVEGPTGTLDQMKSYGGALLDYFPAARQAKQVFINASGQAQKMDDYRQTPQSWWYPLTGARKFDIDEEIDVKYRSTYNQLQSINRELSQLYEKEGETVFMKNTATPVKTLISIRQEKAAQLEKKLDEMSKDYFTIRDLRDALKRKGIPDDEAKAYIKVIVNTDTDPNKMENFGRFVDAWSAGQPLSAMNSTLAQRIRELSTSNATVAPMTLSPTKGQIGGNRERLAPANRGISAANRNPLQPPSR